MEHTHLAHRSFILAADDDEDDRILIEDALLNAEVDAEVHFVEDGEQALDYLKENDVLPSLILLDLNMPRKGGLEVLRELKESERWRKVPVVIFTTSKAQQDLVSSYHLGVNSFITKPLTFDELVEVMETIKRYWFGTVSLPPR